MSQKYEATINNHYITAEEKSDFIKGWRDAGGYMDDVEAQSPCPWCMPWMGGTDVTCEGETAYEWGQSYWQACKDEVESLIKEEQDM